MLETRIFWDLRADNLGGIIWRGIFSGYNAKYNEGSKYDTMIEKAVTFSDPFNYVSTATWLFYRKSVATRSDWEVSKDELLDYIKWYSNKYGGNLIRDKYSEDLFINEVDDSRTVGHNSFVFNDFEKKVDGEFI